MEIKASRYATKLRWELGVLNRKYARGRVYVESYGSQPVIVYEPSNGQHGNFLDAAYAAITSRPEWLRRFDKIHAQGRALPKTERRWRELDSSMSSDALLMNVFCTPGVAESEAIRQMLGVEGDAVPEFGWKARVPLSRGRFDRTEVDMRIGSLLVEAKLTESGFQTCPARGVDSYRDFDEVFARELLPRVWPIAKPSPFPPDFDEDCSSEDDNEPQRTGEAMYASYQLIRNVLAAYSERCSFCVVHDARRPDLREAWFQVMAAVKNADMRVRLKVTTWQELAPKLPEQLQDFLVQKYGIVGSGSAALEDQEQAES